jgi:catechol 2,3-dioxygenase-like lactoylglutathione lyase family enzyme
MSVPAHLSLVTLGVADLDRSIAFYEALGWQRSNASETSIAFFSLGAVHLALFDVEALADDARQAPPSGGSGHVREFRGVTLAINVRSRDAVDRFHGEFLAAGAVVEKAPETTEWGGYSGYVADPDGHLWELAYNPHSPEWAAPGSE